MRWVLALVGALIGAVTGDAEGLFIGLVLGLLLGWAMERERKRARFLARQPGSEASSFEQRTSDQLRALSERVAALEHTVAMLRAATAKTPVSEPAEPLIPGSLEAATPRAGEPAPAAPVQEPAVGTRGLHTAAKASGTRGDALAGASVATRRARDAATPSLSARAFAALRELLLGGNTVVRIGVVVLTVGLGLLAKYATDHAYLPLELRLSAAAAAGMALIVVGYRALSTHRGFATALQGGGVAALYLVTFFSFYSYELLPASLTLALLVAIAVLSSALAIAEDAQQLAVFSALGGFLAPVLASTGSGSHIALFSYYALLNAALFGVALFRAWRVLNWTGFFFTFGVASAWGTLRYEPAHVVSAGAFLLLFFFFYLLNGTLFALRQPGERRGTVDTTLTFGTPLATLGLATGLFQHAQLHLALACVLMAASYLAASHALITRGGEALRTLRQAYLAIGCGLATLAVPLALDDALATALTWSVEAAALVWVGSRQARLRTRVAGYLLFVGALFALVARVADASSGSRALFCALIAAAFGFAAACLERRRKSALPKGEQRVEQALFALALGLFLFAIHAAAAAAALAASLHDLTLLGLLAASAIAFDALGAQSGLRRLRRAARFVLPYTLLNLPFALARTEHPFAEYAWLGWLAAIAAGCEVLRRQEHDAEPSARVGDALHASGAWLVAVLATLEADHLAHQVLSLADGFAVGMTLLAPLLVVALLLRAVPRWPLATHERAYLRWSAWPLATLLAVACLVAHAERTGATAPLPYLPLLNPLDVVHGLVLVAWLSIACRPALHSPATDSMVVWGAAASVFIALNGTVIRAAHHWAGVPFVPWSVPSDTRVQASFSILWTVLALVAMIFAHRRGIRAAWLAGAALLACVVVKLFALDLARLSSVAKIVTFLAVGVLLLVVGYFAPVPPGTAKQAAEP